MYLLAPDLLQLSSQALASVVQLSPALLLRSPAQLGLTCARVKGLLGRSRHWRAGLAVLKAKPGALALTLSFDSSKWVPPRHVCSVYGPPQDHSCPRVRAHTWSPLKSVCWSLRLVVPIGKAASPKGGIYGMTCTAPHFLS